MAEFLQSSSTLMTANPVSKDDSYNLALAAASAADDRKGGDIVLLRVAEVSYLADYFVMITGLSRVQLRAIAQAVQAKVETDCQRQPLRIEGQAEGSWVVLDYGDIIVHIMLPQEREFYNLEAFWGHAERINFAALS
jgi:ribosome-associated protein